MLAFAATCQTHFSLEDFWFLIST